MGQAKHWIGTGVWVGLVACACGIASCTPGELDDKQEKFLRKEINKRYPAPKPEIKEDAADDSNVAPDDDADVDTDNDESTTEETSDAGTSQSEATSAPTTTSESSNVTSEAADAGGGAVGEIPDCFMQMVTTTCAGSACHQNVFMPNLASNSLFELLTTTGSSCSTRKSDFYIDLEVPENSYLLQRIIGEGCGFPMPPPGEGEVSDAEMECLEGWLGSL